MLVAGSLPLPVRRRGLPSLLVVPTSSLELRNDSDGVHSLRPG
jgi:hypothetical protein